MTDILIVEDDNNFLPALTEYIGKRLGNVRTSTTLKEAREQLSIKIPDGMLVDLVLPDGSGLELVDELKNESTQVIIMTGFPSLDSAIAGVRARAVDYLVKPVQLDRLRSWLQGLNDASNSEENAKKDMTKDGFRAESMIARSPAMQRVLKMIEKVAPTDATVLLQGESGTGKEVLAQAIHRMSHRADRPFLAINCGATNENLIGDELFGHERGGFTGASKQHKGFFERANGATLFLDEVTEMPIDLQTHLLRVLETGKFVRIGGDTEIQSDARVIAATNRDPREAVAIGKFREDLYYRLAVFPIPLPPLRERPEDIAALVTRFVDEFNSLGNQSKTITADTVEYLQSLRWPGNIRQLKNAVQRAHLVADAIIERDDFRFFSQNTNELVDSSPPESESSIAMVERRLIETTLSNFSGNKRLAAAELGVSLKTLYNKLKKYEMDDQNR